MDWQRYASWSRGPARILLALVVVLCVLSALVLAKADQQTPPVAPSSAGTEQAEKVRDADLALYDRIIARIADGENYYAVAVDEQRRGNYPVRPGLAVRLPALAFAHAWLGPILLQIAGAILLLSAAYAWWRRFTDEPGGERYRNYAAALVVVGGSIVLNRYYAVVHEFWAGMLILLSLGLHRPGRFGAALVVAALALAVREHAAPYVVLMAAMAFWRGDRREGLAWTALLLVFAALLVWHLQAVAQWVRPNDPASPAWLVARGLPGWLGMAIQSSNLRFLPGALAGPIAVLMVFGWSGWRSPAGSTATLLMLGYALAFMLAGRENNFYWGGIVAPTLFVGLALLPMALSSLWRAARGTGPEPDRQTENDDVRHLDRHRQPESFPRSVDDRVDSAAGKGDGEQEQRRH